MDWRARREYTSVPPVSRGHANGDGRPVRGRARRWSALGEVPLHGGLAGQVDPALAIDLGHHDHHLVTDRDHVLDRGNVIVGQLADTDEALLAGQDLHEGAEGHEAGHGAQVEGADLDLAGEGLDPVDRLAGVLAGDGGNLDGAVVLDVDLGAGLLLDLPDHGAALADDLADLLRVDLDLRDARREVAHRLAGGWQDLEHLVEDRHPRGVSLLEPLPDDRLADAGHLDVHLEGGDPVTGAGHLEVHVPERILLAEDVGQDGERPVAFRHEALSLIHI